MKHLVLGSSGQVGHHLLQTLRRLGQEVLEFDIVRSEREDLRIAQNPLLVRLMEEADFVYLLAFDVGGSLYMKKYQDTYEFIRNNVLLMAYTFEQLERTGKPFLFASSQMSNMSYSTYGRLKALGESYTKAVGGLIVKFWNVYGVEEDAEKSHVITDFIKMASNQHTIRMRTDGREERQFLYGDDCAEALFHVARSYDRIDRSRELHITSFQWTTIMEVARIVSRLYDHCPIVPGTSADEVQLGKKNEPDDYVLSLWKPQTLLEEGIRRVAEHYDGGAPSGQ